MSSGLQAQHFIYVVSYVAIVTRIILKLENEHFGAARNCNYCNFHMILYAMFPLMGGINSGQFPTRHTYFSILTTRKSCNLNHMKIIL